MQNKLKWNELLPSSGEIPEEKQTQIKEQFKSLALDPSEIGAVSLDKLDKLLSLMEAYYSQFGLVQICLDITGYGEHGSADFYEILLDVECRERLWADVGRKHYTNIPAMPCIYRSEEFSTNEGNYEDTAAYGRQVYYALRKKHPALTRNLGEPFGNNIMPTRYKIICKSCGRIYFRRRKCETTEHPEKHRCRACNGKFTVEEIGK